MESLMAIQDWIAGNYAKVRAHAGKWVAVSGKGIIETAASMEALNKKLSEEQKSELLITRIPTKKEAANLVY